MKILTPFLPGGPATDSEVYRHECEVRLIATWRDVERRRYIEAVADKRGRAAADQLATDIAEHWRVAQVIAEMETNAQRAQRLREIALERGAAFAQGLREGAWALMQEGVAA